MNEKIHGQVAFLIVTLCSGMGLMLFYELLRILRWLFYHAKVMIWVEDLLYWGIAAVPVFYIFFIYNDGAVRWYGVLMLILGAYLYEMGISRPVRRFLIHIFGKHRPPLPYSLKKKFRLKKKTVQSDTENTDENRD